jgi:hypothetical protein
MRAYLTIAGDEHDLCSRNEPCSKRGHKGSTSTRSVPQDFLGDFAAGSDPFKL